MHTGDEDVKWSVIWMIATVVFTAISFLLGWAVNGVNGLFAAAVSHGIQWVCCCFHAFPFQTEMYYDLIGSLTYISISLFTIIYTISPAQGIGWSVPHPRQVIATSLVVVWATRLGSFLSCASGETQRMAASTRSSHTSSPSSAPGRSKARGCFSLGSLCGRSTSDCLGRSLLRVARCAWDFHLVRISCHHS